MGNDDKIRIFILVWNTYLSISDWILNNQIETFYLNTYLHDSFSVLGDVGGNVWQKNYFYGNFFKIMLDYFFIIIKISFFLTFFYNFAHSNEKTLLCIILNTCEDLVREMNKMLSKMKNSSHKNFKENKETFECYF